MPNFREGKGGKSCNSNLFRLQFGRFPARELLAYYKNK